MYRLCLLVLLGVWHASAQLTTPNPGSSVDCNVVGIQNCGKCNLPGMTCAFCAPNFVLAADYKSCIACDVNCLDCVLDSTGKIGMCQLCAPGYEVKSDGTCGQCGSYCATCTFTDAAETQTDCLACFPTSVDVLYPYLLGSYSKQCQDCTQVTSGCSSCSEAADKTLSCTGCQPGFIGVTNGGTRTCTACPNHCLSCSLAKGATVPTTCATCETNFVANTAASPTYACLYCDPNRCSKCASSPVSANSIVAQCLTCLKGYYLDNNKVCQPCPAGCATCTSSSVCQSCVSSGFWFDSANTKCTACSYGCNTCTFSVGKETCTACIAGFGLQSSGVSCQECPVYCDACSDPATCTSCVVSAVYDFIFVTDVDGTFCMPCPDNCDTCVDDGNGGTSCSVCDVGYVAGTNLMGESYCFPCPNHCSDCTFDSNTQQTTCTNCVADSNGNDYYLNANNNCVSCGSQCTNCAGGVCGACQPGYFLDTSGTIAKCVKCTLANCQICTPDAATCTTCFPGWFYDTSGATPVCTACAAGCTCTAVNPECDACKATPTVAPFVNVDSAHTECLTCDAKCKNQASCGVDGICSLCVDGYVPDTASPTAGKTCVKCDPNCDYTVVGKCTAAGAAGTTAECTQCVAGYYVNGVTCSKCSTSGCSTCPGNVCSACLPAYTSNGAATIACLANDIHCVTGASSYDSTAKKVMCSSCETGYTAGTPGACLPNPTGCDIGFLDSNDATGTTVLCTTCSTGYGLNSKNLCDPCPANCVSCTADAKDIQVCDTCDAGFAENTFACSECPEGCTACKNVNGEMFCTQCTPQGYYLDAKNGVCVSCVLCTSCSANGCNAGTCVDGYGLASDQSCTDCATLTTVSGCSNCTDADSTGMAMCLDCDNGQVLDGWSANCVDASPLTDCVMPEYRPYECTPGSCNSPFEWVTDGPGRGQCGLHCAVCGDLSRGLFLAECQNANNNYTQQLVVGACWVGRTVDSAGNVLYARGGFDKFNCTSDNQWEFVDPSNSATTYKCCQSGDGCSDEIALDGVAGASAISFSLALLFASILAALRLF